VLRNRRTRGCARGETGLLHQGAAFEKALRVRNVDRGKNEAIVKKSIPTGSIDSGKVKVKKKKTLVLTQLSRSLLTASFTA
jgi:hypothetical protein